MSKGIKAGMCRAHNLGEKTGQRSLDLGLCDGERG